MTTEQLIIEITGEDVLEHEPTQMKEDFAIAAAAALTDIFRYHGSRSTVRFNKDANMLEFVYPDGRVYATIDHSGYVEGNDKYQA